MLEFISHVNFNFLENYLALDSLLIVFKTCKNKWTLKLDCSFLLFSIKTNIQIK